MPEQRKKNILFLTFRFPYPLYGGDRVKSYHILKHLAKNNNVTLVTFFQGEKLLDENIKAIEDLGIKLHVVPLKPIQAAIHSLFHNNPLNPLEINYYQQSQFQDLVDKVIKENHFDVGIAFFLRTASYIKKYTNLKKILIAEDCRILYQQRSYKESTSLLHKVVRYYEHKTLKRFEPKIVKYFDCVTFVTNEDMSEMSKYAPNINIKLLTNGTRTEYYLPDESIEKKHILFTGKMSLWANYLMVKKIVTHIMPTIWKEYPNIKLLVVGADPTKEVLRLASDKVEIHQNVPSFLPYLQRALAFIHPHKGGTGIQNKLLEAMSCGVPVITTKIGNQGINGVHRESIMLGETNEELTNYTLEILKDKELAEKISTNARKLIVDTHSWELIYQEMDNIIEETLGIEKTIIDN